MLPAEVRRCEVVDISTPQPVECDGSYTVVIRSAVPKKPRGVRVKQKILKVLAKIAAREEEGLSEFIRRALEQYLKKAAKKRSRRGR
jgi:hypothetical protein